MSVEKTKNGKTQYYNYCVLYAQQEHHQPRRALFLRHFTPSVEVSLDTVEAEVDENRATSVDGEANPPVDSDRIHIDNKRGG